MDLSRVTGSLLTVICQAGRLSVVIRYGYIYILALRWLKENYGNKDFFVALAISYDNSDNSVIAEIWEHSHIAATKFNRVRNMSNQTVRKQATVYPDYISQFT